MSRRGIEIALPIDANRSLPPAALAQMAKHISASGAVDHFHIWDQMMGWWPPHLWSSSNSPLAAFVPDLDSSGDPSAVAAYAAASAPGLGLTVSTDAIRRGPAEVMQTMLTLANMGQGRAILQIGAGEIKQTLPFGWKRAEGLKRLEDHFRFYQAFWNTQGPVTLEGNLWKFDQAWIGRARQNKPRVWALGGGPKLVELATTYADGFATMVPNVLSTPERHAAFVRNTRSAIEAKGRNPDDFDFCAWVLALVHEDPAVIERAFENPLIKWLAAIFGRLNNADWAACGVESAFPADWHYSMKLLPNRWTNPAEVDAILGKVTRKMCELTFIHGTPRQVAEQIQPYIDAGATCIDLCDTLPIVLQPEDAQASLGRQLDVCARIKKLNAPA